MFALLRALLGAQMVSAQIGRVRREASVVVARILLGLIGLVLALVAVGFFTAAGHLALHRALGPVSASLIVAGVYLALALIAWLVLAVKTRKQNVPVEAPDLVETARATLYGVGQSVAEAARTIDPPALAAAGGRKLAKTVGPFPLAGIAIVAGFLIARRLSR